MGERQCIVCNKLVRQGDETEHLRTSHLGPHYFWFAAREFRTEEPSMTVADILKMVDGTCHGQFFEDREGEWVYYSHGQSVDLTRRPHFSVLLPATMYKNNGP